MTGEPSGIYWKFLLKVCRDAVLGRRSVHKYAFVLQVPERDWLSGLILTDHAAISFPPNLCAPMPTDARVLPRSHNH